MNHRIKIRLYFVFVALVLAAAAVGIAPLELDKSNLRRQIAQLHQNEVSLTRMRQEIDRAQSLIARFKTSRNDGVKAIHADLVQSKAELAALEAKAGQSAADASAPASIDANRDPAKAMTKLKFLSNVGRATPADAFQTLLWAATNGRDPELAAGITLDSAARAKAESILANLPAETRANYSSAEQLAALYIASAATEITAYQSITSSVADDGSQASLTVRVRSNGHEGEMTIPMANSADGWAMVVSENQIDGIGARLTANSSKQ